MSTFRLVSSLWLSVTGIVAVGCSDPEPYSNVVRYGEFAALTVPVDYDDPSGKSLQVEYRIDRANKETKGYVLFLEGGPGVDVRSTRSRFDESLADPKITDNYDRVFFNIRGVGETGTQVKCSVTSAAAFQACIDSVAQIAPIESFTTRNFARDIDTLRRAIGIASWDAVYGSSYGTRLAEEYVRMFPDQVAKLVLDSTVSPALASIHLSGKRLNTSLYQEVFPHCHASPSCMALFPGTTPEAAFDQVLMRADQGLLTVTTTKGPAPIGREDIIDMIAMLLHDGSARPLIPQLVRDLSASPPNYSLFTAIGTQLGQGEGEGINLPVFLIVACNEEFRFEQGIDVNSLRADAGVFGVESYEDFAEACPIVLQHIPSDHVDVIPELVQSSVPSCILAGKEDPVTPIEEATAVASELSGARLLAFPYAAHGAGLSSCGAAVTRDCIVQAPADVDVSCIDREPSPYAYPPVGALAKKPNAALPATPPMPRHSLFRRR